MRRSLLFLLILAAAAALHHAGLRRAVPHDLEVARIRAHLARAEAFAATRDLSKLTAEQRAARARHLRVLAAYRERGVFPENRVSRARTPVFVDARGVHCAVGHLLAMDGERALVAKIAATRNLARIAELADEPQLVAWLDRSGLTVEEAARIQPEYDDPPFNDVVARGGSTTGYEAALSVTTGLALAGVIANLERGRTAASRSRRVLFGTVAGAAGIGMGVAGFSHGNVNGFATASMLTGVAAIVSTVHNLGHRPSDAPAVSWVPMPAGPSRVAFLTARF